MQTVEDILAVVGFLSLLLTVVRVVWIMLSSGVEWIDNVEITECNYHPEDPEEELITGIYPQYYQQPDLNEHSCISHTLILPQQTVIRNLKIKRVVIESIAKGKEKYKTVEIIKTVTPQYPLCMIVERGEAIAPYLIEWHIDYGAKATYYFHDNMRDGNNNRKGIEYTFGLLSKLRKLMDLK